jgi:1-hydroxycarotenoid 3,4-desaturase
MRARRVVVVGAGVAGLVAALELARADVRVTVVERMAAPGGKMREVRAGGPCMDAGPTVLTMRWVFDEIYARAGTTLERQLTLQPARILARHAWSGSERLDLHADPRESAEAIGVFAGAAEARGYADFCARARRMYQTLEGPFIEATRPNLLSLVGRVGWRGLGDLRRIAPFATLWKALGEHFRDPRLRQLFGRYATYCGSSPFLAPATLMLVAHVEQAGVWLVEGGMHRIAASLAQLGTSGGVEFRYGAAVAAIGIDSDRVSGVTLADGEVIEADAVLSNADIGALGAGHLGAQVLRAVAPVPRAARSLSAITWALSTRTSGFPLSRHNVFFGADYASEFDDIFRRGRLPQAPTVYVCAQDRGAAATVAPPGAERLLVLVNAPPSGDTHAYARSEIEPCETRTFALLERCGLQVERQPAHQLVTTPADFERLFPGTGGALYGPASHGWRASFRRPGARSRIAGLYLAGGSTHPGPGVPMAALSGRQAAAAILADHALTPA